MVQNAFPTAVNVRAHTASQSNLRMGPLEVAEKNFEVHEDIPLGFYNYFDT